LLKILREKKPDGIVVSFDSPVPTERHRLFEEYKARRPDMPEDLVQQIPYIKRLIGAFNIPIFEVPGYEADDILATIAKKGAAQGFAVFIVTGDKDMLQIVNERIKVYDPLKDAVLDASYVMERFGIAPDRIPEFMALTGDAIDNIPGVKGIGEKTARELLTRFASLDDLLMNAVMIEKEKLRQLVLDNADMVRLSRSLATLNCAVPIAVRLEDFRLKEPDWVSLLRLFRELEFGSLMKLIPSEKVPESRHEAIFSIASLEEALATLGDEIALDTEATGKDPVSAELVGVAFCGEDGAFYVPVAHVYPGAPAQLGKRDVVKALSLLLEREDIPKIGHNLKYDLVLLKREGAEVRGTLFDTMLASYLLNPNKPNHSLEEVAFEHLSLRKRTFPEVLRGRSSFAEVPVEEATVYACEDAHLALRSKDVLFAKLKEEHLETLYFSIEMPLIPVLVDMEMAGVKVDSSKLAELSKELDRELDGITRRIYFLAGQEFNINSPKQLSRILFDTIGLPPGKRTKTGFSTDMSVLEELALHHELPREILNYRSLSKLKTTYIDVLPTLVNPRTGRIHTSFNQAGTSTGRLSSSEPNLQNVPIRGDWGRRIREAFVADDGRILLSADYSQVELRILAHLSGDEGLVDAFNDNLDIHARTAAELFGIPIDKVTEDNRRIAKTVNFGIIYGISPFGLSETLSITGNDAKKYIDRYFQRHPGVKKYIDRCIEEARQNGYVMTLFGRKRAIPEIQSKNLPVRQQGERLAVNSPIQGSAADIIKVAMINIWKSLRDRKLSAKMILQVHDELLFEAPLDECDLLRTIVRENMEGAASLSVPLKVEIYSGTTWAEAH